ncbi:hypothetical protein QRX60_32010 [Amycolatopsis mongoliensis]|uniref:HTH lacI-type domain-containing protein n=1 Tax=Amycolatopsis mongoliensis TaxID=715475 RepID=A0A9Y2JJ45_9PSEU|nr:hypothetical protein [Amycolatopsis sp. 4-36]WIX98674.1 hypothetical protein QRX60_32010 [Amycolatopsis sp. 4-36]
MKADTRQRVLEVVKRLGYSPDPLARNLRTGGRRPDVGLCA